MTDEQQEKLARRWPDLFQKSGDFELSVGEGWYNIIDILCGFMSYDLEQAKRRLKFAMENPDKNVAPIAELEGNVAAAREALPSIAQVKEKFGSLRFYVDGGTTEIHNYISFAESISGRTCEVCGSPGESRNDGWVKVLCDKHHKEREKKNSAIHEPRRSTAAKLFDE